MATESNKRDCWFDRIMYVISVIVIICIFAGCASIGSDIHANNRLKIHPMCTVEYVRHCDYLPDGGMNLVMDCSRISDNKYYKYLVAINTHQLNCSIVGINQRGDDSMAKLHDLCCNYDGWNDDNGGGRGHPYTIKNSLRETTLIRVHNDHIAWSVFNVIVWIISALIIGILAIRICVINTHYHEGPLIY